MKFGIIGYGNIGKKHHQAAKDIEDLSIAGICDTQKSEVGNIPFSQNLDEFFARHTYLDLISVCTPNAFHKEHSIRALKSGAHVICEKPFALSVEDCQEIIDAAKENNKKIFCVMQNRFSTVMQWLKSVVDENKLGQVYMVNVSCYWNRNKDYYKNSPWRGRADIDGGTLFTQFSHFVDMLYWLFGKMEIENGLFRNYNHDDMISFEDTGIFNFNFHNGGMGSFSYTTSTFEKNFESTLTIISEKGTIKIGGQYMNELKACNVENLPIPSIEKSDNISHLRKVYENALGNIMHNNDVMTTSLDGKNVVEIIQDVYAFKK